MEHLNMAAMTAKAQAVVNFFLSEECQRTLLVDNDFLHAVCLKQLVNKGLSVGIIAGSFLLKVPQMLKIYGNHSAEGISLFAIFLELVNYTVTVVHNIRHENPLVAWAETLNLTFQNYILLLMVMVYGKGNFALGVLLLGILGAMHYVMADIEMFTDEYLNIAFNAGLSLVVASRGIQIMAIFRAGHANNISFPTIFLQFAGSVARVFTTMQEMPDDTQMLASFALASAFNGFIVLQVIYYWNTKPAVVVVKETKKNK
eukprot:CFRG5052T1